MTTTEAEKTLNRLAEQVRVRKRVARAKADEIRLATTGKDIRGTTLELLLVMSDAGAEAFNEVLKLIEEERKK